jgi:hypothetical protein
MMDLRMDGRDICLRLRRWMCGRLGNLEHCASLVSRLTSCGLT